MCGYVGWKVGIHACIALLSAWKAAWGEYHIVIRIIGHCAFSSFGILVVACSLGYVLPYRSMRRLSSRFKVDVSRCVRLISCCAWEHRESSSVVADIARCI